MLKRKTERWVEAGIISPQQAEAILALEGSKSYALYGFISLGILTILTGIISLIAFNWEEIPAMVKLAIDFLLLTASAWGVYRGHSQKNVLFFEGSLLFFQLLVLASIGLIAQVFHTAGELYEALFLWTGTTLPLVFLAKAKTPIHLWILGSLSALSLRVLDLPGISEEQGLVFLAVGTPIALLAAGGILHRFFTAQGYPAGRGLLDWALVTTLLGTIIAPGFVFFDEDALASFQSLYWITLLPSAAFTAILLFVLFPEKKISLTITVGVMLLHLIHLSPRPGSDDTLWNAVFFILEWMGLAVVFLSMGRQHIFDALLAGTGIRFVIVYFEAFGNLAYTGMGLILSGLLIIGLAILYIKQKERVSRWLKTVLS